MKRLPTPCALRRQDCLVGSDLARRLYLEQEDDRTSSLFDNTNLSMAEAVCPDALVEDAELSPATRRGISTFEQVFITCPPIFEALLLHLPTPAILDLYHVSRTLRKFLQEYPLAWKNLSFRLLTPPPTFAHQANGSESPDGTDRSKRPYALDLLFRVLMPYGKRLTRLDLDNTSVSGSALRTRILEPQRATLVHLSVRGCKDVSLKYHILPFLQEEVMTPPDLLDDTPLALKSLYTYRCRHHRRRPYLPSSLVRRDSDSNPTHQLIELCHALNIWTDTAWCPTPGPRCFRRKDYYSQRTAMHPAEVWVPFDRLWRSQNFIGACEDEDSVKKVEHSITLRKDCERAYGTNRGRLWEDHEYGWAGEALGMDGMSLGEGKETPAHARKSHRIYIDHYKCDSCGEKILERCEQCSVRMHCMGCRKTLCPSCAFDRPIRKKRRRTVDPEPHVSDGLDSFGDLSRSRSKHRDHKARDRFWWAPGAERSPNLMQENSQEDDSSDDDDTDNHGHNNVVNISRSPRLDLKWCCMEPSFSGGGGIAFLGSHCGDNVRAAPLPQGKGFEDAAFNRFDQPSEPERIPDLQFERNLASPPLEQDDNMDDEDTSDEESSDARDFDIFPYLEQETNPESMGFQKWSSPRSLCKECYSSPKWRIKCAACDFPICIDHDVKTLKVRRCGYRKLQVERMHIQSSKTYLKGGLTMPKNHMLNMMAGGAFYAKWRPIVARMLETDAVKRLGRTNYHIGQQQETSTSSIAEEVAAPAEHTFPAEATTQPGNLFISKTSNTQMRSRSLSMSAMSADVDDTSPSFTNGTLAANKGASKLSTARYQSIQCASSTDVTFSNEALSHGLPYSSGTLIEEALQPKTHEKPPPAPAPVWTGCSRYFCLERENFDRRPPCSSTALRECTLCTIRVCYICLSRHSPCPCSTCTSNGFLCPNCAARPDILAKCCHEEEERERIRREEEEERKRRLEWEEVRKDWEESRGEREMSDGICSQGGEFWRSIEGGDYVSGFSGAVDLFGDAGGVEDEQWLLEVLFGEMT